MGFFQRYVGDDGTFGQNANTGMILGVQHARSPAKEVGPYTTVASVHNDLVRNYFTSAGIPSNQIASVGVAAKGLMGGPSGGPFPPATFMGFQSALRRTVGGYPVTESEAFAEFNANGEVLRESVYWPPLPASVLTDVAALAALIADPVHGPAYVDALSEHSASAYIAIHHTIGTVPVPTAFIAFGCYDVDVPGGYVHHFDLSGNELVLPQENPTPISP